MHLLLVEDNPDHVFLTRRALQHNSTVEISIDHVEDGESALDYLFHRRHYLNAPRPDLILLDLQLPAKSGLEVLQEVKADPSLRRIPVVILTTSQAQKDVLRSYDLYANEYICKPVSAPEYLAKIQAIPVYWTQISQLPGS